jgi:hypothetical protein
MDGYGGKNERVWVVVDIGGRMLVAKGLHGREWERKRVAGRSSASSNYSEDKKMLKQSEACDGESRFGGGGKSDESGGGGVQLGGLGSSFPKTSHAWMVERTQPPSQSE